MDEMFTNWKETKEALLEGLSPKMKEIVSPVLENQKNHVLSESAAAGATAAHDIAGFRKILIPMIRRIIPGTIASELVGVQPMQGPVGLVYSLRYKYGESVTHDANNSPFGGYNITAGEEAFGQKDQSNSTPIRAFYSGAIENGSPVSANNFPGGVDQPAGASGLSHTLEGEFGSPSGTVGVAGIDSATATGGAWGSSQSALSSVSGTVGGSGSFLEGSGGRKMSLEVVSQAVEAGSRKLQAGWTIEAMQDLQAQHGLDIESEMTQALSAEIVQEIDAEIITDLLALAGTTITFDGDAAGAYGTTTGNYTPAYVGDRLANLGVLVNYVANEIARRTRRGAGNFVVVSPLIVSVLQSASKSVFAPAVEGSFKGPNNTMLVGTLNGTIKVYSYIWNDAGRGADMAAPATAIDDPILVGYKGGNGETDTGYFYCPYIPLMSSGVVVNPVTFQPVVSLMTRYGKTSFTDLNTSLGNSADYYGKVNVSDLNFA